MKKIMVLMITVLVLGGCGARVGNMKMGTSQNRIARQMESVNTKSDVRDTFGTPNLVFERDGREYYEYKTVTGHGRYHWMLPIVGWVMSWWQDTFTYRETNLFVGFDAND
ncbi:hypothetical protein HDR66_00855, partial [bacterium]|nr:hypothetical protein [bacterium]